MRIVILGLTITSSWGNGHATTYRGLVRGLERRGHDVLFLERDKPWYAEHRDMPAPPYGSLLLYDSVAELEELGLERADLVIIGSYVPDGIEVARSVQRRARGLVAFYDIDTPVTLAALAAGRCDYLTPELLRGYGLYLSFTGGPTVGYLEHALGARMARALYCSADPDLYRPDPAAQPRYQLGYLGTFSPDRQPTVERLLLAPARALPQDRFALAGPQYPDAIDWPANLTRHEHIAPAGHPGFYNQQRYTLNVTRADMIRRGYSPSVRLFEAAACGTPIISDNWPGLDAFFKPGTEILVADTTEDVLSILQDVPEAQRQAIAAAGRARVLAAHTGDHRAAELEAYAQEALAMRVRA